MTAPLPLALALALPLALLAVAGILLTGCGSGQERDAATTRAAAAVPIAVTSAKEKLDQVVASLRNLRDASDSADLKQLYGELKADRGRWADALAGALSSSANAVATGQDQITRWHAQADAFTDPGLREASGKREGDLRVVVDALSTSRMGLVAASGVFNGQLDQVIQALDLDLSRTGAASLRPTLAKAVGEQDNERYALNELSARSAALDAQTGP